MKQNFPYRKIYLKNLLASLLVTAALILLAFLSVQHGKNAIIRKQELVFREWQSAYYLLIRKPELLEKAGFLDDQEQVWLPEPFREGIPDTRSALIFYRKYDSLAKSTGNETENHLSGAFQELEDSIRQTVQRYNHLVRESNHFMKAFPNNFYSALFHIPSLPEYQLDSILLKDDLIY